MKTVHDEDALRWHLQNNAKPDLSTETIERVLTTCEQFNSGTLQLEDEIFPNAGVTVQEMFKDLKIEITE